MFHIVLKMCALHNEQVNISLFQHEIFWQILKVSGRISDFYDIRNPSGYWVVSHC